MPASTTKYFSGYVLRTRTFSYINTDKLLKSENWTLMQHCYLIHSPYSSFISCQNNVLYIYFFLTSNLIRDHTWHFTCHLSFVALNLESTVSQSFLVFLDLDLDIFEEHRPVISWNVPQLRFAWCFLTIVLRLCMFGKGTTEEMRCPQSTASAGTWCLFVPVLVTLTLFSWLRCCLPSETLFEIIV